ncbi:MAG: NAD(P)H-dependent oxidoreductase [Puniceicoccales bacterium]|nr:NAD(P)H-dependent oxidoreductase [Puniceicoccales bacterium]
MSAALVKGNRASVHPDGSHERAKTLLFVNSCVNRKTSRTNRIAGELVSLLREKGDFAVDELVLENENMALTKSKNLTKRLQLARDGKFSDRIFRYAQQFKNADVIVIAAPQWNFCFPSLLKSYVELASIAGIVYSYDKSGKPIGLCKAEKLYYVTTRGGIGGDQNDHGFAIIAKLGEQCGIKNIQCISAEGLDILGNDAKSITEKTIKSLPVLIR